MGHRQFFMNKSLKERIYYLAHQRNLSVRKIERDLGWSDRSISKWDTNRPSIDKVKALADYLGMSIDAVIGYESKPESDLNKLAEIASWLTEDDLAAMIVIAEQLKKSKE